MRAWNSAFRVCASRAFWRKTAGSNGAVGADRTGTVAQRNAKTIASVFIAKLRKMVSVAATVEKDEV